MKHKVWVSENGPTPGFNLPKFSSHFHHAQNIPKTQILKFVNHFLQLAQKRGLGGKLGKVKFYYRELEHNTQCDSIVKTSTRTLIRTPTK